MPRQLFLTRNKTEYHICNKGKSRQHTKVQLKTFLMPNSQVWTYYYQKNHRFSCVCFNSDIYTHVYMYLHMHVHIYIAIKNLLSICDSKSILANATSAGLSAGSVDAPDWQLQVLHEPEVWPRSQEALKSKRFCTGPDSGVRRLWQDLHGKNHSYGSENSMV